ncbi:MAG: flagellar biosynthesis protein FlhF [Burkholderiales bacterium]
MNIQRFTAATSREALAKARLTFGENTLILSNRPTENGVEVVAAAEDTLAALDHGHEAPSQKLIDNPLRDTKPTYKDVASKVEDDATQLAMSTLSFQDYVRERMLRKRHENGSSPSTDSRPAPAQQENAKFTHIERPQELKEKAIAKPLASRKATPPTTIPSERIPQSIVDELHAMKELMEDRFNTLAWLGNARQNPIQANLMVKLIRAGYSPNLSRSILERMPEEMNAAESVQWIVDVLERNLKTDADGPLIQEEGGVFALIGATGVGKTTTTAKLAGLCARTHGPGSVGLITLDTYRVGAHEQLRGFGKMLGVVAHLAHDRVALQDLLGLLSNKKMVLIDTTGLAPRDPRKRELLELLDLPTVKRLLVLNAGSHGDTLDEAISAFKTSGAQQTIFSKTDEAVKLGPAIDAAIRNQLVLRGITTGQRVPEDWETANSEKLVRASMRTAGISAYDPKVSDLGFYFGQPAGKSTFKGHLDA